MAKVKEHLGEVGEKPPLFDPLGEGVAAPDPASPTTLKEPSPVAAEVPEGLEGDKGEKKASDKGGKNKVGGVTWGAEGDYP